jgi:hypothetical protein
LFFYHKFVFFINIENYFQSLAYFYDKGHTFYLTALVNYNYRRKHHTGDDNMTNRIVELDVREDLKNKIEPFQKIITAVTDLKEDDIFVLHAPFKPVPLFAVMKAKGFIHEEEEVEKKHWKITFIKRGVSDDTAR